jgi:hypothetical protein
MTRTDIKGRKYLTFKQARAGIKVELDGDFTCARKGSKKLLRKSPNGLWFRCDCGSHLLDGQEEYNGGKCYVGLYPSPRPRPFPWP